MSKEINSKCNSESIVEQLVICPVCNKKYYKALYDFQFIYCEKCKTYFEKNGDNKVIDKLEKRHWVEDKKGI